MYDKVIFFTSFGRADIFKSASDGILSGYANVYNIEDLQGDISRAGCFVKTVSENHKSMKVIS